MKKARITHVFNRRKRLNKDGKGEISIYVYLFGKKRYFATGIFCEPKYWNQKKNRPDDSHPYALRLEHDIASIVAAAETFQLKILQTRQITIDDFEAHFSTGNNPDCFLDFCKKYTDHDNSVTAGTTRTRNQTLTHLNACFPSGLSFSQITHDNIHKFDVYLRKAKLNQNTIHKHHTRLRMFINEAISRDLIDKTPYRTFKVKKPASAQKIILWYQDIEEIEKLSYSGQRELTRLKFLFSCYTGLRISDTHLVTHQHIRNNKLMFTALKTSRPVVVPLDLFEGKAKNIIEIAKEKYNTETIFPYVADQTVNENLKVIAIDANIPFPLTSHVARHTFCTLIAHKTQSPFKVMEYTGITKVETAMIYINLQKVFS